MLDLTFHAIEYAAYQPCMFNDPPDACAKRAESEAKPGRYRSMPPASPRVSLIWPFAASIARLFERILTAMQHVGRRIFSRASCADALVRQGGTGNVAEVTQAAPKETSENDGSDSRYETGPESSSNGIENSSHMHLPSAKESESNKAYRQFCEDSLRALEEVFNSKEAAEIFGRLADFCECRRRIANLNPAVESLNDPITTTYFSGLKRLIGKPDLEKLSACKKSLERTSGNRDLTPEQQLKLHYMWTVVGNFIEFADSKSASLISMKSGNPIT